MLNQLYFSIVCCLISIAGFAQNIDFQPIQSANQLTASDLNVSSLLQLENGNSYFLADHRLFFADNIHSQRREIPLPNGFYYRLINFFGEVVIEGRLEGYVTNYIYRNGEWLLFDIELGDINNVMNNEKIFRYDSDENQLMISNNKGISFEIGYEYEDYVIENLGILANSDYVYNLVLFERGTIHSYESTVLYQFDHDLKLIDTIQIQNSNGISAYKLFLNDNIIFGQNGRNAIKIDLNSKLIEVNNSLRNTSNSQGGGFYNAKSIVNDNKIYYVISSSLYYADIDSFNTANPILLESKFYISSNFYLSPNEQIIAFSYDGELVTISNDNSINYSPSDLDPSFDHRNFILGSEGQLFLDVDSRDRFFSYDNGDTWIKEENFYPQEYMVEDILESYPWARWIQISGDTTAAIRFDDGWSSWTPNAPQPAYDAVTNTYVQGYAFFYTYDNGATWLRSYDKVSPPNNRMKVVDGKLYIYPRNQEDFSFENSNQIIKPSLTIYNPENDFEIEQTIPLEDYPLGGFNGSFELSENGELHQHPRFFDDFSYIDDQQLGFSPAGELYLVPESDASYVLSNREGVVNIYYRENRTSTYRQLNLSPYNIGDGNLYVGKDYLYYVAQSKIYRATHPIIEDQYIEGEIYSDDNMNCENDDIRINLFGWIVNLESALEDYTYYVQSSDYSFSVPSGSYDISISSPWQEWESCNFNSAIDIAPSETIEVNIPFQSDDLCSRLSIDVTPIIMRRCFTSRHKVLIKNTGSAPSTSTKVILKISDNYTFEDSSNPFTIISDTEIEFLVEDIAPFEIAEFYIDLMVDCDAELGDTHCFKAEIISDSNCNSWDDVFSEGCNINIGSYDPNDVTSFSGLPSIDVEEIKKEDFIDYVIRFQNTGTDTALNVRILNTLPNNADITTLEILNSSHTFDIRVLENNELEIKYPNIFLPDSIVNETESHGFFKYRIYPNDDIAMGDEIFNQAGIYFDFNDLVITNRDRVVIESGYSEVTGHRYIIVT